MRVNTLVGVDIEAGVEVEVNIVDVVDVNVEALDQQNIYCRCLDFVLAFQATVQSGSSTRSASRRRWR